MADPRQPAGGVLTKPDQPPPASLTDAHYSYKVYADPAMADTFDQRRFGGPIGELVREREEHALLASLGDVRGRRILDVGTGTGRAALALAERGAIVTGVDASLEMLARARARAADRGLAITFDTGDAHALAFPDRTFDAAVSLRVIMHAPDWRRCLAELCRVSRDVIVFDYPALASAAAIQSLTRRGMHAFGARVEPYRVFTDRAVRRELSRHAFGIVRSERQFAFPIAIHKAIGSRALTERIEAAASSVGVRGLIGSPVTIAARRGA
jgi:SAM-dependent methyltransferase